MSDSDFQGQASTGSGKSEAEVAFELLSKLKGQGVWGERNIADILDMYAECLDAAKGLRAYEGQKRVEAPIRQVAARPQTASAQRATSAQPLAAAPRTQMQQQQPVHAQQQQINQAYKPA